MRQGGGVDASQMTNVTSLSSDSLMLTISPVPFLAHAVSQARKLSTTLRIRRAASRSVVWLPEHTSSLCSTHTGLGVWVSAGPVRLLPALFSNSIRTRATGASRKGKSWNRTKNFLDLKCSHLLLPPISIIKGRVPKKQNENLKLHLLLWFNRYHMMRRVLGESQKCLIRYYIFWHKSCLAYPYGRSYTSMALYRSIGKI